MLQVKLPTSCNEFIQMVKPMVLTEKNGIVGINNKFVINASIVVVGLAILAMSKVYNHTTADNSKHISLKDVVKYTAATVTVLAATSVAAYILLNKMPVPGQYPD